MKKIAPTLLSVLGVFMLVAFLVGEVYKTGQDRPPLKYAVIPDGTLEVLKRLSRAGGDGGLIINTSGGGDDWKNEDDLGSQTESGWAKEEDDNFIVYYHKDKEAVWQGHAQDILREANRNINTLANVMGKYFYPSDMNGRKLVIYLPVKDAEYLKVASELLQSSYSSSSIGVTITEVSMFGCKTKGIVLRPTVFTDSNPKNGYRSVLLHEMNHYVYLSSIDYSKDIELYNWQIEGVAEYCTQRNRADALRTSEILYIGQRCKLDKDFPEERNAHYWAGESFFYYLEDTRDSEFVKQFIRSSYDQPTSEVFKKMSMDESVEQRQWTEHLKKLEETLYE